MNIIKPLVNISKIANSYDSFVVGFRGVLSNGSSFNEEAIQALVNLKKSGKNIVLLSNSPMRVVELARYLQDNNFPVEVFESIVTAGEIIHYKLKSKLGKWGAIGKNCYMLGSKKYKSVFSGLGFNEVSNISQADFVFMAEVESGFDTIDKYMSVLEYAADLSIPLVIVGNDIASFMDGQICLAPGSVAEQYAIIGGDILTIGKPDIEVLSYALEGKTIEKSILIGDSISTDIKAATLAEIDSVLISKGIHVNFLGEGYIPDVTKAKALATNLETYPDYVMSSLRW